MIQHANVIARAAMAGGLVGACLIVAAPAQASPWGHHGNHNNTTNTTNSNTTNSTSKTAAVTAAATTAADPPAAPIPTGIVIPAYGNYPTELAQSNTGFGVNPHTCPAAGGSAASCYQPINTAPLFPVSGTTETVVATTTKATTISGTPTFVPVTTTVTTAVPTSANETFPFVANANGTGASIQLPTLGFG